MFKFLHSPDWGSRMVLLIFTIGSAALSGYWGWLRAEQSHIAVQVASVVILGIVPIALGIAIVRASRYKAAGNYSGYYRMLLAVWCFLPLNFMTDYGSTAAIFDMNVVASKNANTKAKDLRDSLARKRKELAAMKEERAWSDTGLLSPQAYDAKVFALKNETENGRNIWKRSEQCQNTTVASSQRVCQAIATALANKAVAERRQVLLPEIQTREAEITSLEKEFRSSGTNFESSAVTAPISKLLMWITLTHNHDETQIMWGEAGFLLITTFIITAAISFFGWEMGQRDGALQDAPEYEQYNPWIGMSAEAKRKAEAYEAQRAARQHANSFAPRGDDQGFPDAAPTVSKETIILKSQDAPPKTDDSLMQSLKAMEIAAQRALARSQAV